MSHTTSSKSTRTSTTKNQPLRQVLHTWELWFLLLMMALIILLVLSEQKSDKEKAMIQSKYSLEENAAMQLDKAQPMMTEGNQFEKAELKDIESAMKLPSSDTTSVQLLKINQYRPLDIKHAIQYLKKKGILKGLAKDFDEAGRKHNVDPRYLIAHATIETGHGQSKLAKGIADKEENQTYYNFFGIGAFDSTAISSGTAHAKKEAWTSPEKAIHGGAKFIRDEYFDQGQITLYEMRWNPEKPATHQYATDIKWSLHIGQMMKQLIDETELEENDFRKVVFKDE